MTRFKLITLFITSTLFLNSCSEILEPVSLFANNQDVAMEEVKEEFEINIKSLTFNTAKKANNAPYPRSLILTGSSSRANVLEEAKFLKSSFPKPSNSPNYLLGIGDMISFTSLNEFNTEIIRWPSNSKESEYLLGAGDELTLTQSNDSNQDVTIAYSDDGQLISTKEDNDSLILTQGVIGSNGNILLYGLGNILAANRTLDDVRTEVRNILIRDGLAPNFQLEVSDFKSKKAFVTINNDNNIVANEKNRIIFLNNLPITLKQIALSENLSKSMKNLAIVRLTRNSKEYRLTAEQLFNLSAPEIIIQDNDQIDIVLINLKSIVAEAIVGSKGNILLPSIGSISAVNRTIDDLYKEIATVLIEKVPKSSKTLQTSSV